MYMVCTIAITMIHQMNTVPNLQNYRNATEMPGSPPIELDFTCVSGETIKLTDGKGHTFSWSLCREGMYNMNNQNKAYRSKNHI